MSDNTSLPPLRDSSSVAPELRSDSRPESRENGQEVFPFLVHSQDAVANGQPPEVDNEKTPKSKRKRTSPEDQAYLEAEYKRNPKPDKVARVEIVKHVKLSEKEVQIWFQNRRQNTRRKSRPLLPHEIAAFGLGGMAALSSDPASYFGSSQSSGQMPSSSQIESHEHPEERPSTPGSGEFGQHTVEPLLPAITPAKPLFQSQSSTQSSRTDTSFTFSQPISNTPGYLSNRRNAANSSFSSPGLSQVPGFSTPFNFTHPVQPSSCPERLPAPEELTPSSSQVRLSMSLDGKAELINADSSSPIRELPQRPLSSNSNINSLPYPQRRLGGLQRSQSALPFGPIPRKSTAASNTPFIPRMHSGRSRDARTWEFCCDTDARDELTRQAENESNGSAVAAISLLRSTSKTALKSNTNKRNAPPPSSKEHSLKQSAGKKPKLAKSASSMGRLQTVGGERLGDKWKNDGENKLSRSPGGDSDKENWVPGENGAQRRRPLPSSSSRRHSQTQKANLNRRRVLEDSEGIMTHAYGLGSTSRKSRTGADIFEDDESLAKEGNSGGVDRDVERFMRGEISPSKKGDLDCVQGLLSLSQGAWR